MGVPALMVGVVAAQHRLTVLTSASSGTAWPHRRLASDLLIAAGRCIDSANRRAAAKSEAATAVCPANLRFWGYRRWAESGDKPGSESVRSPHACQTRNDTWRHPKIQGDCVLNAYWYAQLTVSQLTKPPVRSDDAHRYKVTRSPDAADLSMAAMSSWRRTASAKSGTV